jgi:hypothetical protein
MTHVSALTRYGKQEEGMPQCCIAIIFHSLCISINGVIPERASGKSIKSMHAVTEGNADLFGSAVIADVAEDV